MLALYLLGLSLAVSYTTNQTIYKCQFIKIAEPSDLKKKKDYWDGGWCIDVLPLEPKPRVKSFHLQYYVHTLSLDFVHEKAMVLFQPHFFQWRFIYPNTKGRHACTGLFWC